MSTRSAADEPFMVYRPAIIGHDVDYFDSYARF